MSEPAIQPAASVILLRRDGAQPAVLMGQRGKGAVFMPSKHVFPGGRVDAADLGGPTVLDPLCLRRLGQHLPQGGPQPGQLVACARRELREETGLVLPPQAGLRFIFRAITPPGGTRRFDARFFLAEATDIAGDLEDFSGAEDELSHLHWVTLEQARRLDLPFITEIVLAELRALLRGQEQPGVPFFDNSGPVPTFRRLV